MAHQGRQTCLRPHDRSDKQNRAKYVLSDNAPQEGMVGSDAAYNTVSAVGDTRKRPFVCCRSKHNKHVESAEDEDERSVASHSPKSSPDKPEGSPVGR